MPHPISTNFRKRPASGFCVGQVHLVPVKPHIGDFGFRPGKCMNLISRAEQCATKVQADKAARPRNECLLVWQYNLVSQSRAFVVGVSEKSRPLLSTPYVRPKVGLSRRKSKGHGYCFLIRCGKSP
jgi:hypothetical protein